MRFAPKKYTSSAVGRSLGSNASKRSSKRRAEGSALWNLWEKGIGGFLGVPIKYFLALSLQIWVSRNYEGDHYLNANVPIQNGCTNHKSQRHNKTRNNLLICKRSTQIIFTSYSLCCSSSFQIEFDEQVIL